MSRIYLSPPDIREADKAALAQALASGWVAPVGPDLDAFEHELAQLAGTCGAVAMASGTAALHLALKAVGVGPGDTVLVPTVTFAASAFPVTYLGAEPVFTDIDPHTWQMAIDGPGGIIEAITTLQREDRPPKALIAVDLYGSCPDLARLEQICTEAGIILIEDAAEAVGSKYAGRPCGSFGRLGIYSFNGNKIVTTSGGGAVVSNDTALLDKIRYWSTQARDPVPWYEHQEIGYNYRLSNLLAALGRSQLARIQDKIGARKKNLHRYQEGLKSVRDLHWMPFLPEASSNHWLSCVRLPTRPGFPTPVQLVEALNLANIEARPLWKPLHTQPVFRNSRTFGGPAAEQLFQSAICLPSGTGLLPEQQDFVIHQFLHAISFS